MFCHDKLLSSKLFKLSVILKILLIKIIINATNFTYYVAVLTLSGSLQYSKLLSRISSNSAVYQFNYQSVCLQKYFLCCEQEIFCTVLFQKFLKFLKWIINSLLSTLISRDSEQSQSASTSDEITATCQRQEFMPHFHETQNVSKAAAQQLERGFPRSLQNTAQFSSRHPLLNLSNEKAFYAQYEQLF